MLEFLADPQIWASFLTLAVLEIILGIDNIIFIAIATEKLPEAQRASARRTGLILALLLRLVFLAMISWIIGLTAPAFSAFGLVVSWRDLILLGGGLFLLYKATIEIHAAIEEKEEGHAIKAASFAAIIGQIIILDLVFSLDSVITAVGMTNNLPVMYAAVIVAVGTMLWASGPISGFVHRHPTVKMLALAFLLLVGVALIADGLQFHIPRGYLYFAIAFSLGVEALNLLAKRRHAKKAGTAKDLA
ncbi:MULTISPECIES: TerC family protein [Inquilinus]|uniref:Tellurium resistance membrane protein TerC n=1 Tax=Inquilinus ginsengisoli TaxID=363840 RepID=A0ABU1JVH7_9PROT|nr:TerC family protein [Inquilinus ginsengisoli]MDR6292626.1 putative tellurium resistance membrane protein TerC [Inquilinus ginsengisoli]